MDNEAAIKQIKSRLNKTTRGAFAYTRYGGGFDFKTGRPRIILANASDPHYGEPIDVMQILPKEEAQANIEFLAHSKTDIEFLLAYIEELEQKIAENNDWAEENKFYD